jgi:hypothetical protein
MNADKSETRMDRIDKIQTRERFGFCCNPVNLVNPVYSLFLLIFIGVYRRLSAAKWGLE